MALTRQSKKREVEAEPVERSPPTEVASKDTAINLPDIEVSLQFFFFTSCTHFLNISGPARWARDQIIDAQASLRIP